MSLDKNNGALWALGAAGALAVVTMGAKALRRRRGSGNYGESDLQRALNTLREWGEQCAGDEDSLVEKLIMVGISEDQKEDLADVMEAIERNNPELHAQIQRGETEIVAGWIFKADSYVKYGLFDADLVGLYVDRGEPYACGHTGDSYPIEPERIAFIVSAINANIEFVDVDAAVQDIITDNC